MRGSHTPVPPPTADALLHRWLPDGVLGLSITGFGQDPRKGHRFAAEPTVGALSEVCRAHAQCWGHDQYCETAGEP